MTRTKATTPTPSALLTPDEIDRLAETFERNGRSNTANADRLRRLASDVRSRLAKRRKAVSS